jgi:hypothetical protein
MAFGVDGVSTIWTPPTATRARATSYVEITVVRRRPEATPSHRRRVAVSGHGETDRVIHLSLFQITSVCAKDLSGAS